MLSICVVIKGYDIYYMTFGGNGARSRRSGYYSSPALFYVFQLKEQGNVNSFMLNDFGAHITTFYIPSHSVSCL